MKIPNKLTCLFLLVVSGLTAGCNQTVDYPAEFALVDSLATYCQPEQALCILDSLKPSVSDVSEAIRHKYDLLYIKATDKAFRPFYTDSLILDVIRYYEKHPSHGQLAESYYYGGRVNTELGDATLAMQYYQKAYDVLKEMPDNAHILRLRSNVCSNIARTLHYLDSDSIGVPYILEALKCDSLMGERSLMVYEFRDLAYAAWEYGRLDSAEMYLEQARIIAFQIQDSVLFSLMQNEFANFYIDARKDYNRVIPLLYYLKNPYESNKSAAFYILSNYYYCTGQFSLAIPYYEQLLQMGTIYAKAMAYRRLAEYYIGQGEAARGLEYANAYVLTSDSVNHLAQSDKVLQLEYTYNYRLREKENDRLKAENKAAWYLLIFFIATAIILVVCALFILMYVHNKRKIAELNAQNAELQYAQVLLQLREHRRISQTLDECNKQLEQTNLNLKDQSEFNKQRIELEDKAVRASKVQNIFKDRIKYNQVLSPDDKAAIERDISEINPDFLQKLAGFCENEQERTLCLLLKYRLKLSEIASLMSCSPQNISKKRSAMYKRIFADTGNFSPRDGDRYIESL